MTRQPQLPRYSGSPRTRTPASLIGGTKLSRDGVLAELVNLGEELRRSTDPSIYPAEKVDYAKHYEPKLQACRMAWAAIHQGQDIETTLRWLSDQLQTGIEYNRLRLIEIAALEGFGPRHLGKVENDRIIFRTPR